MESCIIAYLTFTFVRSSLSHCMKLTTERTNKKKLKKIIYGEKLLESIKTVSACHSGVFCSEWSLANDRKIGLPQLPFLSFFFCWISSVYLLVFFFKAFDDFSHLVIFRIGSISWLLSLVLFFKNLPVIYINTELDKFRWQMSVDWKNEL